MKSFTREHKNKTLTITMDDEAIIKLLDNEISSYLKLKGKELSDADKTSNAMCKTFTYNYCTVEEIIEDLLSFKQLINGLWNNDAEDLWSKVVYKKDGTFKVSAKPQIKVSVNSYFRKDDKYSWDALVLRLVPKTDTILNLVLDNVAVK